MLCLSGFELYSRWVPLVKGLHNNLNSEQNITFARFDKQQDSAWNRQQTE